MKNSSISCVVLELALLLVLAIGTPVSAAKSKKLNPEDLTNFLLAPRYSQWLVGPIAQIASPQEIKTYLGLQVDEEAAAFIAEFWLNRGASSVIPGQGPKDLFDSRVEEADRIFSDGTNNGHRSDRGTLFVLYGEPDEIRFEAAPRGRGDFLEIWEYANSAEEGLNDKKPERFYRFVKRNGRTSLYRGPIGRKLPGTGVRQ